VTNVSPRSKKITRMVMAVAPLLGVAGRAMLLVDSDSAEAGLNLARLDLEDDVVRRSRMDKRAGRARRR
jgi:hypothetical protein